MAELPDKKSSKPKITIKSIGSLSRVIYDFGVASGAKTAQPDTCYDLLRLIEERSETISAINTRVVEDVTSNGYGFIPSPTAVKPDEKQYDKCWAFFRKTEAGYPEWLTNVIHDYIHYGMGAWEISTQFDPAPMYDGDIGYVTHDLGTSSVPDLLAPVDWSTFRIRVDEETNNLIEPPGAAYIQQIVNQDTVGFTKNKIIEVSDTKRGGVYGYPRYIPLFTIIAAQTNLTSYIRKLNAGEIPKHLLNVGDMDTKEFKELFKELDAQIGTHSDHFGIAIVNIPDAKMQIEKIVESPSEGGYINTLYYYREQICAVVGIPPIKMGWVQTGKLANPEQQLDSWYDAVEAIHRRVESAINNKLFPLLEITDYLFKFNPIRPKKDKERAEALSKYGVAARQMREQGILSVNEIRDILGYDPTKNTEDDDPSTPAPTVMARAGGATASVRMKNNGESGEPWDFF